MRESPRKSGVSQVCHTIVLVAVRRIGAAWQSAAPRFGAIAGRRDSLCGP
jgi:hypothetical protein